LSTPHADGVARRLLHRGLHANQFHLAFRAGSLGQCDLLEGFARGANLLTGDVAEMKTTKPKSLERMRIMQDQNTFREH